MDFRVLSTSCRVSRSHDGQILVQNLRVTHVQQNACDDFSSIKSSRANFFDVVVTNLQRRATKASALEILGAEKEKKNEKSQFAIESTDNGAFNRELLAELGDAVREPGHFAAGAVFMHDVSLRRTHDHRLRVLHRGHRRVAVAAGDRFLDLAHGIAQQGAARLVDFGAARDLARGFAG
jgi:hypothetical protein